jgi:DNA mismatch endonuclease (patch repair protein)
MYAPPLIDSVEPVMAPASSAARNSTARPISSGSPRQPTGISGRMPEALRRRTMQAIKSKNTKPEMIGRHLLHAAGYRYRLHVKTLPGKPDLVFPGRRAVIFVHGCFWHGHDCPRGACMPKSNRQYWSARISRNKERDQEHIHAIRRTGWRVLTV